MKWEVQLAHWRVGWPGYTAFITPVLGGAQGSWLSWQLCKVYVSWLPRIWNVTKTCLPVEHVQLPMALIATENSPLSTCLLCTSPWPTGLRDSMDSVGKKTVEQILMALRKILGIIALFLKKEGVKKTNWFWAIIYGMLWQVSGNSALVSTTCG